MPIDIRRCKVLVIGTCGYIGSRLLKWLVDESKIPRSQLTAMDVLTPIPSRELQDVVYYKADTADRRLIYTIISKVKPDVIFHTASAPHHTENLETCLRINVKGTRNLLDVAVVQPSVKAFVYTSDPLVIHDFASDLVEADETSPLLFMPAQALPYYHSMALAEQLALGYNRKRPDFVVAAIRPSGVFGPGEPDMIPRMVENARDGWSPFQIDRGKTQEDLTYVDNAAHAHVLAAEALLRLVQEHPDTVPDEMRVEGEAFIITNDVHSDLGEFARSIGALAGLPLNLDGSAAGPYTVVTIPQSVTLWLDFIVERVLWLMFCVTRQSIFRRAYVHFRTMTRTFDISKAKKRLGYSPRFSIAEGMRLTMAHFEDEKKEKNP